MTTRNQYVVEIADCLDEALRLQRGRPRAVTQEVLRGEARMPRYEFRCEKCKKGFELTMAIAAREKAKVRCPRCKGTKVVPQLGGFMVQTSKKS